MATVYFVRDGRGEAVTDPGREVSLSLVASGLPDCQIRWSPEPPLFDGRRSANPYTEYRYVVVHVNSNEIDSRFNAEGYWWLQEVSPEDFTRLIP